MDFNYTPNALKFKEDVFFELDMLCDIEDSLGGLNVYATDCTKPYVYEYTPNLLESIKTVESELYTVKNELRDKYDHCISQLNGDIIHAIDLSLNDFLEDATFCLATSKDDGITKIKVNNIFAKNINDDTIPKECSITIPELSPEDSLKLGVYMPDTGTIILWIDRIFKFGYLHPEILFQKVLLHELIHALLDISPRYIIKENGISKIERFNSSYNQSLEECYDNMLVLHIYKQINSYRFFGYVYEFIKKQPSPYCNAIDQFKKTNFNQFKQDLSSHLTSKLLPAKTTSSSQIYQYYCIDNVDYSDMSIEELDRLNEECAKSRIYSVLSCLNRSLNYYPPIDYNQISFEPEVLHDVIYNLKGGNPANEKLRFSYRIRKGNETPDLLFTFKYNYNIYQYDCQEDRLLLLKKDDSPEIMMSIMAAVNPDTDFCLHDINTLLYENQ